MQPASVTHGIWKNKMNGAQVEVSNKMGKNNAQSFSVNHLDNEFQKRFQRKEKK